MESKSKNSRLRARVPMSPAPPPTPAPTASNQSAGSQLSAKLQANAVVLVGGVFACFAALVLIIAIVATRSAGGTPPALPVPTGETDRTYAEEIINGLPVRFQGSRNWLGFYKQNARTLGLPTQAESQSSSGRYCMTFEYYVMCYNTDPRFAPTLGFLPEPIAVPKEFTPTTDEPLMEAYKERLKRENIDPNYWLGQARGGPFCSAGGVTPKPEDVTCVYWFEYGSVRWPKESKDPATVRPEQVSRESRKP